MYLVQSQSPEMAVGICIVVAVVYVSDILTYQIHGRPDKITNMRTYIHAYAYILYVHACIHTLHAYDRSSARNEPRQNMARSQTYVHTYTHARTYCTYMHAYIHCMHMTDPQRETSHGRTWQDHKHTYIHAYAHVCVHTYITYIWQILSAKRASEDLDEDQIRQFLFDLESSHQEFIAWLHNL